MAERKHHRRSRSQGYFHQGRPDDIYIQNPDLHTFAYPYPEETMPTPELLFDDEEKENNTFRRSPDSHFTGIELQEPRNFFLEKPPSNWKSEETPISPGVTVLLSPAYGDGDSADLDVIEFFQAYVVLFSDFELNWSLHLYLLFVCLQSDISGTSSCTDY